MSKRNWLSILWWDYLIPIVVGFGLVALFNVFYFFAKVPTGSMIPTIQIGDTLFVTRLSDTSQLEVGDVVVFDSLEYQKPFVKRLMGVGGDHIEIQPDGTVLRNGNRLEESYVKCPAPSIETQIFEVPESHFFFLGDNRCQSLDARYWEDAYIHQDQIMGKVQFVIWPWSSIKSLS